MTSKLVSLFNDSQPAPSSDQSVPDNLQSQIESLRRLSTFKSVKSNSHPLFSSALLSKAGFYYTELENQLKCDACDFTAELSISYADLVEQHVAQSPQCQFVLYQKNLLSENNQSTLSLISSNSQSQISHSNSQNSITCLPNDSPNNLNLQKKLPHPLSEEAINQTRIYSFSNWPLITPNAHDMINAGWFYTNIADRVMCIHCNALFHKWIESDRPYEIHRLRSPDCSFVLAAEKKVSNPAGNGITITTRPNTQVETGAAHANFKLSYARRNSFATWPHTEQNPLPPIEALVDAGFFYTGNQVVVRCFYCSGALRNWRAGDDPKVEHARWYPQCAYIRQYVGEDLYEAIQRKSQELKAQQNYLDLGDQTSKLAPWTNDEIDRMVKARLDLPVVEKLRKVGYSMAIIRKVFELQLRFKKDDFKTDNDLYVACLMLDQQVKVIGGDDTRILTPHEWMSRRTEVQEQNVQRNEPQPLKTIQTPIQTIESIKPTVSQSSKIQKTDQEIMLCTVCLITERQIACLPCGHLTSCVACGHSLKTCPFCRAPVKAFVRIHV